MIKLVNITVKSVLPVNQRIASFLMTTQYGQAE